MQQYPSRLLQKAVDEFAQLPGVGQKTALRYALSLLKNTKEEVEHFTQALFHLRHDIVYCKICHNISDTEICEICSNERRDRTIVCVVENIQDVMAIENTQQYNGLYHVLGGIISPIDGIGPNNLNIESLLERIASEPIKEVILALASTMEGDTTNFYLSKRLKDKDIKLTTISRGISIGDELQYTDEVTLGRSIISRIKLD